MKKLTIQLCSLLTGALLSHLAIAQDSAPSPENNKLTVCIKGDSNPGGTELRQFSVTATGDEGKKGSYVYLQKSNDSVVNSLEVGAPREIKLEESGNAQFVCASNLGLNVRWVGITIYYPPDSTPSCTVSTSVNGHRPCPWR